MPTAVADADAATAQVGATCTIHTSRPMTPDGLEAPLLLTPHSHF